MRPWPIGSTIAPSKKHTAWRIQVGARLFGSTNAPKAFKELDIGADHDDSIQLPDLEGKPVPSKYADVLQWTPEWTKWPDFERVAVLLEVRGCTVAGLFLKLFCLLQTMWLNHTIKTLWPVYNEAIAKMAMEQAKPQIDAALKGVSIAVSRCMR